MGGNGWPDVLALLIQERDRLNRAIAALEGEPKRRGRPPRWLQKRARPRMSAAARKALSRRMRAYWALRRKQKKPSAA